MRVMSAQNPGVVMHFDALKTHQNRSPFVIDFSGDKGIDVSPEQ